MTVVDDRPATAAPRAAPPPEPAAGPAAQLVAAAHQHAYGADPAVPARRRRHPRLGAAAARRQPGEGQRVLRRRTRTRPRCWTGSARSRSSARPGSPRSTCCCSPRWSAASCPGCATTSARCGPAPPAAPKRLDRLPQHAVLPGRRPAARRRSPRCCASAAGGSWCAATTVSAEKGYLKETGNLLFHFSLLARADRRGARLLVRLARQPAAGGRRGQRVLQHPPAVRRGGLGPRVDSADLPRFCLRLDDFAGPVPRHRPAGVLQRHGDRGRGRTGRPAPADFSVNSPLRLTARTSTCSATGTPR